MLKTIRNAKGFTLVELAIVLVIIGIILGAVLKGQEIINNAKIKRIYSQYREIAAATYTYVDRYQFFPGDDNNGGRWAGITNGNANGMIGNLAASTAPDYTCAATGTEQCDLWAALRSSNLIGGATSGAAWFANPSNAYGGRIAVSNFTISARTKNWVHFQNIPAESAQIIDTQYDDGVYNTGSIRAGAAYTAGTNVQLSFEL